MFGIEHAWLTSRDDLGVTTEKPRQLFITQSRTLASNVEEYYHKLSAPYITDSNATADPSANTGTTADLLVDRDEEATYRDTLPDRYSDLRDEHFPLFLSFDRVSASHD